MRQGFVQRAAGHFSVMLEPGTPHCGPIQSNHSIPGTFGYSVAIEWTPNALDQQGFLLDNTWFRAYFESLAEVCIGFSCERLSEAIAQDICRAAGDRVSQILSVRVTVEGIPGVFIECHYAPARDFYGTIGWKDGLSPLCRGLAHQLTT